jgi:hypothetical protein
VVLDLHNVESAWHESLARSESGVRASVLKRFATRSAALERRWLPKFDALLVTSRQDAELVRGVGADPAIYPNALPEIALPARQERREIAFSGNLEYQPNIAAVRFFRDEIWPTLRRENYRQESRRHSWHHRGRSPHCGYRLRRRRG